LAKKKGSPITEVYQLKVVLKYVSPPVWRRIQVPGNITLNQLHGVLQVTMGWSDYHLHLFKAAGRTFTAPATDESWDGLGSKDEDDTQFHLHAVLTRAGQKLGYVYDFGDGWQHEIRVEKILPPDANLRHPICLAGKRACPPEDCGGPGGYYNLLEALRDPHHKQHEELTEWVGGGFDPEAFDLEGINSRLKGIKIR
jgi:hypothetical protein